MGSLAYDKIRLCYPFGFFEVLSMGKDRQKDAFSSSRSGNPTNSFGSVSIVEINDAGDEFSFELANAFEFVLMDGIGMHIVSDYFSNEVPVCLFFDIDSPSLVASIFIVVLSIFFSSQDLFQDGIFFHGLLWQLIHRVLPHLLEALMELLVQLVFLLLQILFSIWSSHS